MEVCEVSRERARELLEASGGTVKTAIVMQFLDVDRTEAERALTDANGLIRRAVKRDPPPVRTA